MSFIWDSPKSASLQPPRDTWLWSLLGFPSSVAAVIPEKSVWVSSNGTAVGKTMCMQREPEWKYAPEANALTWIAKTYISRAQGNAKDSTGLMLHTFTMVHMQIYVPWYNGRRFKKKKKLLQKCIEYWWKLEVDQCLKDRKSTEAVNVQSMQRCFPPMSHTNKVCWINTGLIYYRSFDC